MEKFKPRLAPVRTAPFPAGREQKITLLAPWGNKFASLRARVCCAADDDDDDDEEEEDALKRVAARVIILVEGARCAASASQDSIRAADWLGSG